MEISNFIVKVGHGKITALDKSYRNLINGVIQSTDEEEKERWETYNLIIKELLKLEGTENYFSEIKYRITDGEDPNEVIIDIIGKNEGISGLAWQLRGKIGEYMEDDFLNKCC